MMFYEDTLYIDMCRKSEEIQDIRPRDLNGRVVSASLPNIETNYKGDFFVWVEGVMNPIWLPRLDQLLDMTPLDWMLRKNGVCVEARYICNAFHYESAEVGMLQIVMESKYNKHWDFDKKEWIAA